MNAGLHDYPAQPHTGFLLAHAGTAVELWQEQQVAAKPSPARENFDDCFVYALLSGRITHPRQ